jgi:hypothetical protein
VRARGEELGDAGGVEAVLGEEQPQAVGRRGSGGSPRIYKKQSVRREDQETPNPSRSRSFCGEGDVDGGGLTGDNDGGGVKWSRGAPTREVAAAEAGSPLARGGGAAETGYRHGSDRMPGRGRPDAVVAAASRLGGVASRRRSRARLASTRGNPPGRTSRGFLPRGKLREAGCDPRLGGLPKGAQIWPKGGWHRADWPREKAGIPPGNWAAKVGLREEIRLKVIMHGGRHETR